MSRDSFIAEGDPSTFHRKCDNKGATIIAVKDDKGYVFGGYVSVSYTGKGQNGKTGKDPNAWLFALKSYTLKE